MKYNKFFINFMSIQIIILFSGCLQQPEHCPPSYGLSVRLLAENDSPYINITRSDLVSLSLLADLLDDVLINSSLSDKSIFLGKNEWDHYLYYLKSLFQEEGQSNHWIVYYNGGFFLLNTFVMVC